MLVHWALRLYKAYSFALQILYRCLLCLRNAPPVVDLYITQQNTKLRRLLIDSGARLVQPKLLMIKRREAVQAVTLAVGAMLTPGLMRESVAQETSHNGDPAALLAELAEVIIPTTDTPGAKAAGVEKFIVRVLRDCHTPEEVTRFYAGLSTLERECHSTHGKPFGALSPEQKSEFLRAFALPNKPFFSKLKQLTVTGYFNSEIGATQALAYIQIPGRFQGSVALEKGQKTWAL